VKSLAQAKIPGVDQGDADHRLGVLWTNLKHTLK
jgi:hypothetical protein